MSMKVAFVGLGTMGQPMAKNVAKKGHALSVFNRTPEKALPLKEVGAALAASPKEAAKGADVVILMLTGPEAVDQLLDGPQGVLEGLDAGKTVVNMSTVKPLDQTTIIRAARETGALVTAEEHNIAVGMGNAVAMVLAENAHIPMKRVGIPDVFGESGESDELMEKYGLTFESIVDAAHDVMHRKKK